MPDGRTHEAVSLALCAVGALAVANGWPWQILAGLGVGVVVTPDLDVDHITRDEQRLYNAWRPLGIVWRSVWALYAFSLRHRSPLSHWPVVGTLGRAAYMAVWLWGLGALLGYDWMGQVVAWPGIRWVLLGWAAQDALHWAMDWRMGGR